MFCSADNITWKTDEKNQKSVTITPFKGYDKPYGATFAAPSSLVQIFFLFFTDELLTGIVTETNRYARLCLKEKYDSWEIITLEEIKAYFGLMIIMGIVKLPALADYWRKNEFFNYRPIASRITRTRFLDVHRFLHFIDNDTLPSYGEKEYNKIQKVKNILNNLCKKCNEHFIPGQNLAIDEAMIKFKGRSSMKQYMPKKPVKRGFKLWMRADSASGHFEVYQGKVGDKPEKGLGANVVMRLTESISGRYHHVYFDNYFTGIDLLLNLLKKDTYACGTMRSDTRGFPTRLKAHVDCLKGGI